jgi:hypothetical protein
MYDYRFRFLNRDGGVEADFPLHFNTDDEAITTARELHAHNCFAFMEVKKGSDLVLRLDQDERRLKAQ